VKTKSLLASCLIVISALIFGVQVASAHTTITVGDYEVEVGWVNEPPVVGQQNAIVVNVSNTTDDAAVVDISNLTVTASYGGQTKDLTLQPAGEDTTNEYVAPILPTVAGQYTVQLRGQLDTTDINEDVDPEEVDSADTLEFPSAEASQTQSRGGLAWSDWLAIVGAASGLAGLIIALLALRRSRA
jgi:hypothetical protein